MSLVGDSRDTLAELLPHIERKEDRSWQQGIVANVERWEEILADRAMQKTTEGINPTRIFHELSPRLPDDCILTADSGSATNWWARHLKLRKGMKAALSGTLATMCPGIPYAFAAKMAYPERPVIASLWPSGLSAKYSSIVSSNSSRMRAKLGKAMRSAFL